MALSKKRLVVWLKSHDFSELPGKKTSHRQFRHKHSGVVVTVQGKGRPELSNKHRGMVLRQLEKAGFDKQKLSSELR